MNFLLETLFLIVAAQAQTEIKINYTIEPVAQSELREKNVVESFVVGRFLESIPAIYIKVQPKVETQTTEDLNEAGESTEEQNTELAEQSIQEAPKAQHYLCAAFNCYLVLEDNDFKVSPAVLSFDPQANYFILDPRKRQDEEGTILYLFFHQPVKALYEYLSSLSEEDMKKIKEEDLLSDRKVAVAEVSVVSSILKVQE